MPSSSITGLCHINGRRVFLTGQDFTVKGGSGSAGGGGIDAGHNHPTAMSLRLPTVNLIDGSGGSVEGFQALGRTDIPDGTFFGPLSEILTVAPVASAILGPAAGGLAPMPCLSHFSVMVKGIGQVFPGGPPVVKAALGYDIDKEDLGGYEIHTRISGVVNNAADTEEDAMEQIRRFLSYLPDNVWEMRRATNPWMILSAAMNVCCLLFLERNATDMIRASFWMGYLIKGRSLRFLLILGSPESPA